MPPNDKLRELILTVKARRPRTVLEHLLKHGQITTDELKTLYGYNHPPRAARDVRELGIPLETVRVTGPDGRKIAAYKIGDLEVVRADRAGRRALPKALKQKLAQRDGEGCFLCGARLPLRALQIDHRIPYEISGDDPGGLRAKEFMLVCGSCNRAKSWSCENCPNWTARQAATCRTCFWSGIRPYSHIATSQRRQLTLTWSDAEVGEYQRVASAAERAGEPVPVFVKKLLSKLGR